jgi:hypothetical protein
MILTSQEGVKLDQQLQVDVVGLWSLSVTGSGVLLGEVISTHGYSSLMISKSVVDRSTGNLEVKFYGYALRFREKRVVGTMNTKKTFLGGGGRTVTFEDLREYLVTCSS